MSQHINSNFIPFTPASPAPRGAHGQAAVASGIGAAAPDPAEAAACGATRGRPSGYAPKVIDMLCDSIRRFGLSDSAAAEQQGMSTSTLSRWKQLYPEIGLKLKQARQEIRTFHLQRIMDHAATEDGKGWRASAWILERLFPGDYSPRMRERFAHMNLEDRLRDRETHEALDEQLRELHAMHAEQRAARAAAEAGPSAGTEVPRAEPGAGLDGASEGGAPTGDTAAAPIEAPDGGSLSVDASHNSQNTGRPESPNTTNRAEGLQERGRPGSLDEAAPTENSRRYSETDAHNSRNSDGANAKSDEETGGIAEIRACELEKPVRPGTTDANGGAALPLTRNIGSAHSHPPRSA